jgi:hypothetical protein
VADPSDAVDQVLREARAQAAVKFPGQRWRREEVAIERLIALGEPIVPELIERVGALSWEDEDVGWTDEDVYLRALVGIGDPRGVAAALGWGAEVVAEPSGAGDVYLRGIAAILALGTSSDPAVQRQLADWVLEIGTGEGWYSMVIAHLLGAAAPFLDDRAEPVLVGLLDHPDIQDVAPSARTALRKLRMRG